MNMLLPDGFIFGFFDNSLLILGAYFGITVEYRLHRLTHDHKRARKLRNFLKKNSKGAIGGLVGAGLAHVVSNGLGAYLDPTMRNMVLGIAFGTLIPVLFIPIIEKYKSQKISKV